MENNSMVSVSFRPSICKRKVLLAVGEHIIFHSITPSLLQNMLTIESDSPCLPQSSSPTVPGSEAERGGGRGGGVWHSDLWWGRGPGTQTVCITSSLTSIWGTSNLVPDLSSSNTMDMMRLIAFLFQQSMPMAAGGPLGSRTTVCKKFTKSLIFNVFCKPGVLKLKHTMKGLRFLDRNTDKT